MTDAPSSPPLQERGETPTPGEVTGRGIALATDDPSATPGRRRTDFLVGSSPAMLHVLELVAIAARTEIPVLIVGESGTGKELVARAVHYTGARASKPFITVNCGAIPETLMEDELFGHARGAFTGAASDKKGVFEEATGGTLFFDEIGELPPSCQVKLLRALQEGEVRRLGETRNRPVDIRVVSATNRDLGKDMAEKRFREDLYHRISVLPLAIPPLRDRREDLPLLVSHCVRRFGHEMGRTIRGFTPRAIERLMTYHWPGNVRELENRVRQAMAMTKRDVVDVESLALFGTPVASGGFPSFRSAKAEFERNYVINALHAVGGKVATAARLARKERKDFYDLMKRHQIDPAEFRK